MGIRIKEVAKMAKVSVATVSRVINDSPKVNPATRDKVLEVIKEVDYHPNSSGLGLRTRKTYSIGVVSQHFAAFYHQYMYYLFAEMIRGITAGTRHTRYDLVMARPSLDWQENTEYLRLFKEGKVDGVVIIYPLTDDPNLNQIKDNRWPAVLLGASSDQLDYVDMDNRQGVEVMLDHLVGLGHKRIGIINGRRNETCYGERFAAFRAGLARHGLPVVPELVAQGAEGEEDSYMLMKNLLAHRPTAVFAANDLFAAGAARAIKEAGLAVPRDIALGGFIDTPQAVAVTPPLTTVHNPLILMGIAAAELLINRIENRDIEQQKKTIPGKLVVRGSTTI